MGPADSFYYRSGLQAGLEWLRSGGRAGIELLNELRRQFPGFTRGEYGAAATYARQVFEATQWANRLGPNQQLPSAAIPGGKGLGLDRTMGERFKVRIDVTFQPEPGAPVLTRGIVWHGVAPPTGTDIREAVLEYLLRQLRLWGTTPGSEDLAGGDGSSDPADALIEFQIVDVRQLEL